MNENYGSIRYSGWGNAIIKQIDQDIIYGKCLFFFDDALLRAMKSAGRGISINMDWFRKYMKEERLDVFTVTYDGIIEQKKYKDFDFLIEISQTCPIASETDDIILNRNMKIFASIIKGYGFEQDEIDNFEAKFKKYCKENDDNARNDDIYKFLIRQKDERTRLYGNILHSLGNLPGINQLLCRNIDRITPSARSFKMSARVLGILDIDGIGRCPITRFIDRFYICKYFPGYLRNKDIWNKLRGHRLSSRQFDNIRTGKTDVIKGIDHFFNENSDINNKKENIGDINQNQIDNDKEINIKINNKDQIIDINIRTKQKNIDDAWQ